MSAVPMLPAGPKDCQQRLEYLSGRGGVELKTGRIGEGDWARKTAQTVKSWGRPVTWHVPEEWTARMGFADFDILDLIAKMSAVEPLLNEGLVDGIVFHCGAMRWVETFNSTEALEERYTSRYTCREILDQIEVLIKHFSILVDHFGPEHILIENTPTSMWREVFQDIDGKPVLVDMDNFLGPQLGTLDTVLYLSRMTGAGVVLDTGHFSEDFTLMESLRAMRAMNVVSDGEARTFSTRYGKESIEVAERLFVIAGYWNVKGKFPYIHISGEKDLLWYIRHAHINHFHIDACRGSFFERSPDCERPVLTQEDADLIHLDEIIKVAKANPDCLGLLVENVGSDIWPFATKRPPDWEGKRRTFEFIEKAIAS